MKYTRQQLLAMTIWGEARNQTILGQILVGQVIYNRWKNPGWWGKTLEGVILKPYQFSCWNKKDPNREKMISAMSTCLDGGCDKTMKQTMWIADGILLGKIKDYSKGANHYHHESVEPFWSIKHAPVIHEDSHLFYKL